MADLYTSLVRAKQELNGGVLPAMTPIPERLHGIIDPAFTVGMGALREDPEKGLQCPIRGCGVWRHLLSKHLNQTHGQHGANGVRDMLGIPQTVRLVSRSLGETRSQIARQGGNGSRLNRRVDPAGPMHSRAARHKSVRARTRFKRSAMRRNFLNSCDAQMRQRLLSIHDRIGRSPSVKEARAIDPALDSAAERLYGSWNNFKFVCGLSVFKVGGDFRKLNAEGVVNSLAEWYRAHGRLPSSKEVAEKRLPILPVRSTILKTLNATSWTHAMQIAASMLDIREGRYGARRVKL